MPIEFHFIEPHWFWLLIPWSLLCLFLWQRKQNQGSWQQQVDPQLQPYVIVQNNHKDNHFLQVFIAFLGVMAIMALAGPTWEKQPRPVYKAQSALVIALDLSASMYSEDIKSNRLERARFELEDLLRQRKEGQTALVVFAGSAFAVAPLTDDSATVLAQVQALSPDIMPVQGSRTDLALLKAAELLRQNHSSQGNILLLTDGIPKVKRTINVATDLKAEGFIVSVMGVGTEQGSPIPLTNGGFLQDKNGNIVIPTLSLSHLQQVAHAGGGIALMSRIDDQDLQQLMKLWQQHINHSSNDKNQQSQKKAQLWKNQGIWLVLLLIPFVALSFRRGWLLFLAFNLSGLLLLLPAEPSMAFEWQDLWLRQDQQAQQALENQQPEKAAQLFENPARKGVSQYLAQDYEAASESLKPLQTVREQYNYANTLAQLGQYEKAVQIYDQLLKQQSEHENARYNRDQVKKYWEKQPKQPQNKKNNPEAEQQKQEPQSQEEKSQTSKQNQNSDPSNKNDGQPSKKNQSQHPKKSDPNEQGGQSENPAQQHAEKEESAQKALKKQQQQAEEKSAQPENVGEENNQALMDKTRKHQQPLQNTQKQPMSENERTRQQALNALQDDPAALWRRKFKYQYSRQTRVVEEQQW